MGIMLKVVAFVILTSRAFAEDFTNITTKAIYPNAKVIREEPDGLTLKWVSGDKRGMTKVYFWELPAATQQAFHYDPQSATSHYAETQRKIKENAAEQQAKQQEESRQYASSDLHKTIKKSTASRPYTIVGKILQMKGTSALITEVKEVVAYKVANTGPYTTPLLRDSTKWETQYKYEPMTSDRIYVCGLSPAYVDGQTYQGAVVSGHCCAVVV